MTLISYLILTSRVLRLAAVLLAAVLLLTAGATLAQSNLPPTEGGDWSQPYQPGDDAQETESGAPVEFISPQGYVDSMATDDNFTLAPNEPDLTFSYYTVSGPELQPRTTSNNQTYSANGCVYWIPALLQAF